MVNPDSPEKGGYTALMIVLGVLYVIWELFV